MFIKILSKNITPKNIAWFGAVLNILSKGFCDLLGDLRYINKIFEINMDVAFVAAIW